MLPIFVVVALAVLGLILGVLARFIKKRRRPARKYQVAVASPPPPPSITSAITAVQAAINAVEAMQPVKLLSVVALPPPALPPPIARLAHKVPAPCLPTPVLPSLPFPSVTTVVQPLSAQQPPLLPPPPPFLDNMQFANRPPMVRLKRRHLRWTNKAPALPKIRPTPPPSLLRPPTPPPPPKEPKPRRKAKEAFTTYSAAGGTGAIVDAWKMGGVDAPKQVAWASPKKAADSPTEEESLQARRMERLQTRHTEAHLRMLKAQSWADKMETSESDMARKLADLRSQMERITRDLSQTPEAADAASGGADTMAGMMMMASDSLASQFLDPVQLGKETREKARRDRQKARLQEGQASKKLTDPRAKAKEELRALRARERDAVSSLEAVRKETADARQRLDASFEECEALETKVTMSPVTPV